MLWATVAPILGVGAVRPAGFDRAVLVAGGAAAGAAVRDLVIRRARG